MPPALLQSCGYRLTQPCRTTGEHCDILRLAWGDGSSFLEDERCSDCWLGVWSMLLSSPLWYDERSAEQFSDELLNCNKPKYDYTDPMQYAYNTSTCKTIPPASPTDPARCPETYTIQAGDDCESVAARNKISSFSLLRENGLNTECYDFPGEGHVLCVPWHCDVYKVLPGDTCDGISHAYSISAVELWSWNPTDTCNRLYRYEGRYICVR